MSKIWNNLFGKPSGKKSYFETILGYRPADVKLYECALTHKSNTGQSNERLEYLGDAVISLVIAERLYFLYPNQSEGFLTRARAKVVCREHLNLVAHQIKLDKHLHIAVPLKKNTENVYGNALEALVGAIYLDKGFGQAKVFVEKYIAGQGDAYIHKLASKEVDFKSRLLELGQAKKKTIEFLLLEEKYSAKTDTHTFIYEVRLDNQPIAQGAGRTKLEAQQVVAHRALNVLK